MTWFEHIGAIRWKTKLTPRLREIAIVRVAQAAKYAYALQAARARASRCPTACSLEECEALKDWRASGFFSEAERAALAYVDAMIAGPEVPDDVFNAVRKHYNEREVVELTVLVGTYLMHNRVFTALGSISNRRRTEGGRRAELSPSSWSRTIRSRGSFRSCSIRTRARSAARPSPISCRPTSRISPAGARACGTGSAALYPAEVRHGDVRRRDARQPARIASRWWSSCSVSARDDLAAAPRLKVVQKFGTGLRNIDTAACAEKGIKLLTLRRRANISCAEHAFGLMLMLARKLDELDGLVTVERIKAARGAYRPFDRRHTPGGNYARLGGTRALNGATIGIIGLGEIGHEIAVRARAFDMNVLYHQRTRAPESRGARIERPSRAACHAAGRKRLDRPATADAAVDARSARPRRARADQARRLHRQRRQRRDHQPRRPDRSLARRHGSAAWRSTCIIRSPSPTTTSCCRSTTSS